MATRTLHTAFCSQNAVLFVCNHGTLLLMQSKHASKSHETKLYALTKDITAKIFA